MSGSSVAAIDDLGTAAAMLSPIRLRILRELGEPGSASSLAPVLELPRQKINYHLRELEKNGLVELVEERRKGNCIERIVCATARSWVISPSILGEIGADPERVADRFSVAYLIATLSRSIRELVTVSAASEKAKRKLATLTIETEIEFATAETRNDFAEELTREVTRLTAKYHDERAKSSRRFRLVIGSHVIPKK